MSQSNNRIKRRVWIALIVAGAGVGAWVAWNRVNPVAPAREVKRIQPFVKLAGVGTMTGDPLLREKAELMDPTPLFFPTEWNYGQQPLRVGSLKQPGQVFGSFEPKLTVGEQNISNYGAEAGVVPEKLVDVLVQGNEAPLAGIGHADNQRSSLPIRAGYIEIRSAGNGEIIIAQQLSGISPPRIDFAPLEFLIVVGTAGLIGDPVLVAGSGWEEVDLFFRAYLVSSYRLGERLRPGLFRVLVGA